MHWGEAQILSEETCWNKIFLVKKIEIQADPSCEVSDQKKWVNGENQSPLLNFKF